MNTSVSNDTHYVAEKRSAYVDYAVGAVCFVLFLMMGFPSFGSVIYTEVYCALAKPAGGFDPFSPGPANQEYISTCMPGFQ